jgi:hypothetical protein
MRDPWPEDRLCVRAAKRHPVATLEPRRRGILRCSGLPPHQTWTRRTSQRVDLVRGPRWRADAVWSPGVSTTQFRLAPGMAASSSWLGAGTTLQLARRGTPNLLPQADAVLAQQTTHDLARSGAVPARNTQARDGAGGDLCGGRQAPCVPGPRLWRPEVVASKRGTDASRRAPAEGIRLGSHPKVQGGGWTWRGRHARRSWAAEGGPWWVRCWRVCPSPGVRLSTAPSRRR